VAIQPPRGYGENPVAIYHDPRLAPAHHYLATYRWLAGRFDALVHLGKHGTLEWLPGKALGLSSACAPDVCLAGVPLFYPFVVNDPGEGMQAKRRAHAVVIDHLVPPMMRAETYDELAQLEQLLDDYARAEALDPAKLPTLANRIWSLLHEAELHRDLELDTERPSLDDFGTLIEHVDGYLCEIKDLQVRDGLHILGQVPAGEQLRGLLGAILRLHGLRDAVAATVDPGPGVEDRIHEAQTAALDAFLADGTIPVALAEPLGLAEREVLPKLFATAGEIDALIGGLHGRHVPAGPSGSPTRGRLDVLPTGRNMYSVDPRALPSDLAYETGVRLADALLAGDDLPETVGIVVWGTAAMRTAGDDAGEILALLGVRPVWNAETRRVTGLSVVPLEELGRPRIDVTVRISGFFRDAFPHLVDLLDEAVTLVAGLDEPVEMNFVRKHVLADLEELEGDWRRATARVFGGRPGTYGTGILQLVDVRNWRDDADLAEVYEAWGGHAYGRGLGGVEARSAMRRQFARIDVAVKNVDTREHDLLDSSDYFAEHGGMIAYVRHLAGADPRAVIGDSSDPGDVRSRSLAEEARRVFRSRVANPRWIASMMRHGYKGAFELSATVDYLFGYDATTGVVEDWMYEQVTERYVGADEVRDFLARSNPWALRAIAERLLEASERGLWAASERALETLREAYLDVEGELEEASA
jgi:cobaltochelatase CobN